MSEKKKGFFGEFKDFISRGNVVDMAIGVVVGAAFTAIVNSLVTNILNPIVGLAIGGIDFGHLKIVLKTATEETPELAITYGVFINSIINFLIISLAIFCIIRTFNKAKALAEAKKKAEQEALEAKKAEEEAKIPPAEAPEIVLLKEIRDLLKK